MLYAEIFLAGMATMGLFIAGLFFFRFWSRTRDRLFVIFGVAFWLIAVTELFTPPSGLNPEPVYYVYVLRIIAFLLLIAGIVAKNLEQRAPSNP
ncbi:MAG TPA: DUF5985 family protein [Micropepsaceae bacterium]|nr:DUF5985 family protein [Micropepsaceae bacterium]